VLWAYTDETGIHDGATATTVGGVIGHMNSWITRSDQWTQRLARDGIGEFHATKCRGGHGEFHAWRPDFARMSRFYTDLAAIAEGGGFLPVSGSVPNKDWAKFDGPRIKTRFPTSYRFCFELCLYHIYKIAERMGEQVMVFYALTGRPTTDDLSARIANVYLNGESFSKVIKSIAPGKPKTVWPLQMADMAAFELYHLWHSKNLPVRPPLELLSRLEGGENGFFYNLKALRVLERDGPSGFLDEFPEQ
jgi:hypothetical protein